MANYKDRFTPEQLEQLKHSALVGSELKDWERMTAWDESVPPEADPAFTGEVLDILRTLFEENKPTPPEDIQDDDYFVWIDEAFFKFVYEVLNEIFNGELTEAQTEKVARIIFDQDTWLTTVTRKETAKTHRQTILAGQLRFIEDGNGNLSIIDEEGQTLTEAIAKRNTFANINGELLEAIGTGVEEQYKRGHRGMFRISRKQFEDYLNVELPVPPEGVLDFINRGGMDAPDEKLTDEDRKLKTKIQKHYSYWEEISKLDRAGMLRTPTGTYKALIFRGYDKLNDDIILESPYYEDIFQHLNENRIKSIEKKNDVHIYDIEPVAHVLKGSIVSVRNKATVETVKIIVERLFQQNKQSDSKKNKNYKYKDKTGVKLDIGYGDLMKNNNRLYIQLTKITEDGQIKEVPSKQKRTVLERVIFGNEKTYYKDREGKRTISYLEHVIDEHTVLKECFHNFSITCDPISLNEVKKRPRKYGIHIRHEGLNGEYRDNPLLLPPVVE